MKAWEEWAYIVGENVLKVGVQKVGGYSMAQWVAKELYGDEAFAVECSQTPLSDNAKYIDGAFWNYDEAQGVYVEAVTLPTAEETAQNNSDAIDDILVSLLEV
jgi:phage baseplate assembly protein gpV